MMQCHFQRLCFMTHKEQTYYIETDTVKIYKNNSQIEDSPKPLGDVFLGIV